MYVGISHYICSRTISVDNISTFYGCPLYFMPAQTNLLLIDPNHNLLNLSPQQQLGYTFLPCVLAGLSNAPQYIEMNSASLEKGCILASDVDSVILPRDACGGDGALAFSRNKRHKV